MLALVDQVSNRQRPTSVRETLFGDMSLVQLSSFSAPFERARKFIESGDKKSAITTLQEILETDGLESRLYLQAYRFLAELGINPMPEKAKNVLGVLVEVGMKGGTDIVAGYADHHARYYNFSGAAVLWGRPDSTLDDAIDELLQAATTLAQIIGPWKEARPPAPTNGRARINVLTPSGLHFGEGPLDVLAKDKLGGPVISSAIRLMQRLTKISAK